MKPAPLDALLLKLDLAARLLDEAAGEVRDAKLAPVSTHIERLGTALVQVFEIQQAIHALRPDLKPAYLSEPSPNPEANKQLMGFMVDASELEREGDTAGAIEKYRDFLGLDSTPHHRAIAEHEIARLAGKK
ncbi:MAG: hypothetical protein JWN73_4409 [Betaproteobacteria bacterium]|nr:hypothetical protein [Betaproteobacteria bacterium]